MQIDKCEEYNINEIYNLVCELEDTKLDYADFEIAFKSKIKKQQSLLHFV